MPCSDSLARLRCRIALGFAAALLPLESAPAASAGRPPLWAVGTADGTDNEFALAAGGQGGFLRRFGRADAPFYVGLSDPQTDWPAVLPGPLDGWAGSSPSWDQMHTLPIGFTLATAPSRGTCALVIDVADAHPTNPPTLRITVNGRPFDRRLAAGGGDPSLLAGDFSRAKPQSVRVEFPASLLRVGYNEISLRSAAGSWLVFDDLRLEAAEGAALAAPSKLVVRSISAAPYAVAPSEGAATALVEIYSASADRQEAEVAIDGGAARRVAVAPGLQVLEVPARPSAGAGGSRVVLRSAEGRPLGERTVRFEKSPPATPADYVNVFNGSARSRWMIAPGPWMPFGMCKLAPDNQPQGWAAGYDWAVEQVDCFSHLHEWTMAGLGTMPTLGPLRTTAGLDGAGFSSRFDKSSERGGVGFYEVLLKDTGIKVELAATTRCSLQRYTFPKSDSARVMLRFLLPNEYEMHVLGAEVRRTGPAEIEGVVRTDFPELFYNGEQRFDLHFVMQFSRPFDRMGGWEGSTVTPSAESLKVAGDCGAFAEFATAEGEAVEIRTGLSLVDAAGARRNLEAELSGPFGWDFGAVVRHQREAWNALLGRIGIEVADAREKSRFYTNYYRTFAGRNTWSDADGRWVDPRERVQQLADPDDVMLGCDAFWTTFWNLNQVMNLTAPEWSRRWVRSEMQLYDKCGWLAKGPAGLEYISVMVAEHEIPLLVSAVQAGVRGLDAGKILEASVKMQTTPPQKFDGGGWVGNENLVSYLKHHYVADDDPPAGPDVKAEWRGSHASNTMEYAFDDWCVSQLAGSLGRDGVRKTFAARAQYWRNAVDPALMSVRRRRADGSWVEPFDRFSREGMTEGNGWQYLWFVPQDPAGLAALLGRDRFADELNRGFEESVATRFASGTLSASQVKYIDHGNQPTMQASWLFNWAGRPWLSQKWVRAVLESYYGRTPADAYLGDEDQGQMSGWFVMASLGMFQTDGGCREEPAYELVAPRYPRAVIHLPEEFGGRTFTVEAPAASAANCYIQSATLNGAPLERWWISRKSVLAGGTLRLEVGPTPNERWAKGCPPPP